MESPRSTSPDPERLAWGLLAAAWLTHALVVASVLGLCEVVYGQPGGVSEAWVSPVTGAIFIFGGLVGSGLSAVGCARLILRGRGAAMVVGVALMGAPAVFVSVAWLFAWLILGAWG